MRITTLAAAAIGAIVGAALWAVIAATTGYEVGYVAWAVGLLVGLGAKLAGGGGKPVGVVCAVMALAAIFGGKMMAGHYVVHRAAAKFHEALVSREAFDNEMRVADDFAKLKSEREYPSFMASHHFAEEGEKPGDISAEDVKQFTEHAAVRLKRIHDEKPTYEVWRNEREEIYESGLGKLDSANSLARMAASRLGVMDLVFGFLGVATAYRVAQSGKDV